MNLSDYYQHHSDCLLEDMDGEMLLFNPSSATTLHLNAASAIIWELCTGDNSVADIVITLQEAYPDQAKQIEQDVMSAIQGLLDGGALELLGDEVAG